MFHSKQPFGLLLLSKRASKPAARRPPQPVRGGMPGNMNNLMKQAQKMQRQMEEQQKEMEEKE